MYFYLVFCRYEIFWFWSGGPRIINFFKSHGHFPEYDVIGGLAILDFGVGCANPKLGHETCQKIWTFFVSWSRKKDWKLKLDQRYIGKNINFFLRRQKKIFFLKNYRMFLLFRWTGCDIEIRIVRGNSEHLITLSSTPHTNSK